jgi:hypothetical protein
MTLAHYRSGIVHILDPKTPNTQDPWQRALCGDPGDFMELNNECPYCGNKIKLPPVTCNCCLTILKERK